MQSAARYGGVASFALALVGCFSSAAPEPADDAQARAAGYLAHERSIVDPYCHAVLAAPDRVLTARPCLDAGLSYLSFALERDPSVRVPVRGISIDDDGVSDIVALDLEAPIDGEAVMSDAPPAMHEILELTSFAYVVRGEQEVAPSRWSAEVIAVDSDSFVAEWREGTPGCHGDTGIAAFSEGRVLGVLVGAQSGGPEQPQSAVCISRYVFQGLRPHTPSTARAEP
jgi:hypothetical protein